MHHPPDRPLVTMTGPPRLTITTRDGWPYSTDAGGVVHVEQRHVGELAERGFVISSNAAAQHSIKAGRLHRGQVTSGTSVPPPSIGGQTMSPSSRRTVLEPQFGEE